MIAFPRGIAVILSCCFTIAAVFAEQAPHVLRISVENRGTHVQVRMLKRFIDRVHLTSGGALRLELYDSARLYRDSDVVGALSLGKVEMAVPGIWQLDRYAPDFASLMLPSVYGLSEAESGLLVDGEFGAFLSASLSSALPVEVLGRWMELGGIRLFFIGKSVRDLRGLRVRVAGGAANEERIRALGGQPVSIPWPDFPSYIARGSVDAVLTTYETIASANLQDAGIGAALEESHYIGYYLPMVNRQFWASLSVSARVCLLAAWDTTVDEARLEARSAQDASKKLLAEGGLRIQSAPASETLSKRASLLTAENNIADRLHISEQALSLLHRILQIDGK